MRRSLLSVPCLLVAAAAAQSGPPARPGIGDRPNAAAAAPAGRSSVYAANGMVCTSQPLASRIALDVLRRGGSAVDAAIAANVALALMEPVGCGLGGDLFAIVWDPAAKQLVGLNSSGPAPGGLSIEQLRAAAVDGLPPALGPLAVSVPGAVEGWRALHERYGRLPFAALCEATIAYAEQGFPVSEIIAYYWQLNFARFAAAGDQLPEPLLANARATFLVDGAAPRAGQLFANPGLAATLRRLADAGPRDFYDGELAAAIDAWCRAVGCPLRKADLSAYRAEWVAPVATDYRGVEVWELPPNGQGIAALQMLNVLEGYDLAALGHNSAAAIHLMVEAKKVAFADRAKFYADPRFVEVPVEQLIGDDYAAQQRTRIDPARAAVSVGAGNPRLEKGDTTYLCAADGDGMMVSLIQSNYMGMGSGLVPGAAGEQGGENGGTLGFMLQNRGCLFSLDPDHANCFAPGKRPFHTIIPAFATRDGAPWLAFGVMGGAMQPQGHTQIICNLVDFGMGLQAAGDAPRWRHDGSAEPTGELAAADGGGVFLESAIDDAVAARLRAMGHRVARGGSFGGYQAIRRDPVTGVYEGASEMRKDGCAIGY